MPLLDWKTNDWNLLYIGLNGINRLFDTLVWLIVDTKQSRIKSTMDYWQVVKEQSKAYWSAIASRPIDSIKRYWLILRLKSSHSPGCIFTFPASQSCQVRNFAQTSVAAWVCVRSANFRRSLTCSGLGIVNWENPRDGGFSCFAGVVILSFCLWGIALHQSMSQSIQ